MFDILNVTAIGLPTLLNQKYAPGKVVTAITFGSVMVAYH
jgi:hypothetical protein